MIKDHNKKIKFLSNFSKEEFFLNGHEGDEYIILGLFEYFIKHIKKGKYLELGCGTGIYVDLFIYFLGKK